MNLSYMDSNIDLNLFKTFILMIESKNLKHVGEQLGKGESAISKQLYRLSHQLGYPLFERSDKCLEPTPMALELYPKVKRAVDLFDEALSDKVFDSASYDSPIKIAVTSNIIDVYGSELLKALRLCFPIASINIATWSKTTEQSILHEETTLGINFFTEKCPASLYQKLLSRDELAFVVSKKQSKPTFEEVSKWPFVLVKSTGWNDNRYPFVEYLEKNEIFLTLAGSVESIQAALDFTKEPGYACATLASMRSQDHIIVPLPSHLTMPINLATYVKVSHRQSPLIQKLLLCLQPVFANS